MYFVFDDDKVPNNRHIWLKFLQLSKYLLLTFRMKFVSMAKNLSHHAVYELFDNPRILNSPPTRMFIFSLCLYFWTQVE